MEGTETPAPAAPTSSADITASVVHEAEATDASSGSDGYTETPRIDTTTLQETTPAITAKELSEAAKFLQKEGHLATKKDGRDTWLPYSTIEKMLDRYAGTHRTRWDGERSVIESRATELQAHIDALRASVGGDETAFLRELAQIDPRYQRFLETPAPERETAAPAEMPGPDLTLPDGSQTYSLKGLQALLEWNTARVEAKVDERFKPFAERDKAEKARADQQKQIDTLREQTHGQMQEAQTWPLFGPLAADGTLSEFQQSVLDELKRDTAEATAAGRKPRLSLEGAYIRVAGPRWQEEDGKKRERLLKELNTAPKGSALSRQTTDTPRPAGPRSSQDVVREVLAKVEAGG